MIVLGIDTSCDDTGVGITRDGQVVANVVVQQTALHARFGGVVPEEASREHLEVIDEAVGEALLQAGVGLRDLDAVGATFGPGLVGALLVGLSYGKTLAWGLDVPVSGTRDQPGVLLATARPGKGRVVVATDSGWIANFAFSEEGAGGNVIKGQDNWEIFRRLTRWAAQLQD